MEIKGLNFAYGNATIFEDFDFYSEAKVMAIKGPTGCGKTTLLKIISKNLLPRSGHVLVKAERICFIIQEDSLFPWLSGTANISKILNIPNDQIYQHKMFSHLRSFIEKRAYEMSYGQRRLIELFRTILYAPDLLLLDEPFSFIDSESRKMVTMFLKLLASENKRIMLSSHHNEDLFDLSAEVHVFDGKLPVRRLKLLAQPDDIQK